jgi:membrane-associated phospholipid phosphatase
MSRPPWLPWRPAFLALAWLLAPADLLAGEPAWSPPPVARLQRQLSPAARSVLAPLAIGGVLTALACSSEDPDRAARQLDNLGIGSDLDAAGSGWFYAAGVASAAGYGLASGDAGATDLARDLAAAGALTTAAVYGLKAAVGRPRPDGGAHSFPSGHTALAFTSAPILTEHFGWKAGVPAYLVATFVGASRMEDRRHYLSDVLAGAAIGLAAGGFVAHRRAGLRVGLTTEGVVASASW